MLSHKEKGPERANASSLVSNPFLSKDQNMNVETHSTAAAEPTSELPVQKCTRLARKLAKALAEDTDGGVTLAVIYPAGSTDYPLQFCYGDDFAAVTGAAFRYREAYLALAACKGKGRRTLTAECRLAHEGLMASFLEVH